MIGLLQFCSLPPLDWAALWKDDVWRKQIDGVLQRFRQSVTNTTASSHDRAALACARPTVATRNARERKPTSR